METEKVANVASLEELQQRHRVEKKSLQARIQQMKKASGKSDKKKKKELDQTIANLEEELKRTHLAEMTAFEANASTVNNKEESLEPEVEESQLDNATEIIESSKSTEPRISRARRRREKKAASEAVRQEQIAASELEAGSAERAVESAAIREALKLKRLRLVAVAPDGDCLYSAIRHQLQEKGRNVTVQYLRRLAADYIIAHKNDFTPFMCDPVTGDMLTEHQFDHYCKSVALTKAWGTQIELQALSSALRLSIHIIQADPPGLIIQGEEYTKNGSNLVLTYHRHLYRLGEHYNSTRCLDNGDSSTEEC